MLPKTSRPTNRAIRFPTDLRKSTDQVISPALGYQPTWWVRFQVMSPTGKLITKGWIQNLGCSFSCQRPPGLPHAPSGSHEPENAPSTSTFQTRIGQRLQGSLAAKGVTRPSINLRMHHQIPHEPVILSGWLWGQGQQGPGCGRIDGIRVTIGSTKLGWQEPRVGKGGGMVYHPRHRTCVSLQWVRIAVGRVNQVRVTVGRVKMVRL